MNRTALRNILAEEGLLKAASIPSAIQGVTRQEFDSVKRIWVDAEPVEVRVRNYFPASVPVEAQMRMWNACQAYIDGEIGDSVREVRIGPGNQMFERDGDGTSFWFEIIAMRVSRLQGASKVMAPHLRMNPADLKTGFKWNSRAGITFEGQQHGSQVVVALSNRGQANGARFW